MISDFLSSPSRILEGLVSGGHAESDVFCLGDAGSGGEGGS